MTNDPITSALMEETEQRPDENGNCFQVLLANNYITIAVLRAKIDYRKITTVRLCSTVTLTIYEI